MADTEAQLTPPRALGERVHANLFTLAVLLVFLTVFGTWLALTPGGVLGKADAVGYAICHRIDERSYHIHDRQLPLCSRDTGIYLGVLVGVVVVGAAGRSRAGEMPPPAIMGTLILFIVIMAIDGVNSYSHFFEGAPHLYEARNWLRLLTGTFHGLAFGSLVYPVFNMTVWRDYEHRPTIASFKELGGLVAICGAIIGLVLWQNPAVLTVLALLSALGAVLMLTIINTVMAVLLLRRENAYSRWRDLAVPLLIGLTFAFVELGVIDALRFALTGTWAGFDL